MSTTIYAREAEILADGVPLFATARNNEQGWAISTSMLYLAPHGDYHFVPLTGYGEARAFGSLADLIEWAKELRDAFIEMKDFGNAGVDTQFTRRVDRLDIQ